MTIEEYERIVYDWFEMDPQLPPLWFRWEDEFLEVSYTAWAIREIKGFIREYLSPRTEADISEYVVALHTFIERTETYEKRNERNTMFTTAKNTAVYICDMFEDMQ